MQLHWEGLGPAPVKAGSSLQVVSLAITHSCSSAVDDVFTKYAVMHWKPETKSGLKLYYLATEHLQLCNNKDSIFIAK